MTERIHDFEIFLSPCHWRMMQNCIQMGSVEDAVLSPPHAQALLHAVTAHILSEPSWAQTTLSEVCTPLKPAAALTPPHVHHEAIMDTTGVPSATLWRWQGAALGRFQTALHSHAPADLSQQDVANYLPRAPELLRLQNELQMLLYQHSVNDEREAMGLAPINSVWFYLAAKPTAWTRFKRWLGGVKMTAKDGGST